MKTLDQLTCGKVARIQSFIDSDHPSQSRKFNQARLSEMGVCPGENLEVMHLAPIFRDPIAVRVGNRIISIGRKLAKSIQVLELTG